MNDLISRQAVIEALKIDCSWDIFDEYGNITEIGQNIIETISRVPSAQTRMKGRWVKKDRWYCCSECGEEMFFTGTYDENQHYCYNCGADMRGEQNDQRISN